MSETRGLFSLLLLNGGVGVRVGAGLPKQLLKVRGIPILVYSLVAADRSSEIGEIILNYPDGWRETVEAIVTDYAIETPTIYVPAGNTRHESVAAMLPLAKYARVMIHESARPMVSSSDFSILAGTGAENVSYMSEIPFTVAPVNPNTNRVVGSLERDRLRNVQLPQKYLKADLEHAHKFARSNNMIFTEDATLVAESGRHVEYIDGSPKNFKVTSPVDVRLATFLMQEAEVDNE